MSNDTNTGSHDGKNLLSPIVTEDIKDAVPCFATEMAFK